jgi:Domain of unknown function (DUF4383)
MSTAPAGASRAASVRNGRPGSHGRSTAQWYCLVVGATLLLIGILGFLAEAKFDTSVGGDPGRLDGEDFLIFEVNGWHNVVHILSGAFLLLMSSRHARARTGALAFGAIYGLVAVIGLIDGHDVLGIIPIDPADNVLHVLLAGSGLAIGLISHRDHHGKRDDARTSRFERTATRTTPRERDHAS